MHIVQGAGHGLGGPVVMQLVSEFFESHLNTETPAPPEGQADAADAENHPDRVSESKPPQKRKDVPIEGIAPELATHEEVAPLDVRFKRLSAFRLRHDVYRESP